MTTEENPTSAESSRRAFLSTAGKFAVTVPPAMTVLLFTSMDSPAIAQSGSLKQNGNNGIGNGVDPQPPGNPPINDPPGTFPGKRRP